MRNRFAVSQELLPAVEDEKFFCAHNYVASQISFETQKRSVTIGVFALFAAVFLLPKPKKFIRFEA